MLQTRGFGSMERTTGVPTSGAWIKLSALSLGTGIVRRILGSLAARQDLQHSADQDVMCVVTWCPLGAVQLRAGTPRGYVFT